METSKSKIVKSSVADATDAVHFDEVTAGSLPRLSHSIQVLDSIGWFLLSGGRPKSTSRSGKGKARSFSCTTEPVLDRYRKAGVRLHPSATGYCQSMTKSCQCIRLLARLLIACTNVLLWRLLPRLLALGHLWSHSGA